ncbi:dynamin family protein [Sphingomonas oryzagri]
MLQRLVRFRERLVANRFQLAVLGQFKRGKSSLLNAVLDYPVLPTGVVPLTALPVFIRYAPTPELQVSFVSRPKEALAGATPADLRNGLARYATESGNPCNRAGVARIEIGIPSDLLADGLVLIDTPGIGSAERHNSEAARAALPECDGVLLVLSPDPPITEAEVEYLREVGMHASSILPVLTKVDLVSGADRSDMLEYCGRVLARIGLHEPVVAISVLDGTADRSGVERLREHIRGLDATKRRAGLEGAIARKTWSTVTQLQFQNDVALAALEAPIDSLKSKVAILEDAASALQVEQRLLLDHVTAEAGRLHQNLDADAGRLRERVTRELLALVAQSGADDRTMLFAQLSDRVGEIFPLAFEDAADRGRQRLGQVANRTLGRARSLLTQARETAAQVMGVTVRTPETTTRLAVPAKPGWRQRASESMNPLPPGTFERLLPMSLRMPVVRRAMREEARRLAMINTEHLRWTLRQACNDALRAFGAELQAELTGAIASVSELAVTILKLREDKQDDARAELERRTTWGEHLARVADTLRRAGDPEVAIAGHDIPDKESDPAGDL